MSDNPVFDFVQGGLSVSYVASAEPQELFVEVTLADRDPNIGVPGRIRLLEAMINAGAAGGADFAPEAGGASVIAGPVDTLDRSTWDPGPNYRFTLEVRGVSTSFIRVMASVLAMSAPPIPVTRMSIAGSRRRDDVSPFITDAQLRLWPWDGSGFPGPWVGLPFEVIRDDMPRGCAVRATFKDPLDDAAALRLHEIAAFWGALTVGHPNMECDGPGERSFSDHIGMSKSEYSRFVDVFDFEQDSSTAILLNMLARFSKESVAIDRVDLRLP